MWLVPLGHKSFQNSSRTVGQTHGRLAGWQIHDAHVAPVHTKGNSRAEGLGTGLLGGKALGIGGSPLRSPVRLLPLDLSKAALGKALAIPRQCLFDTTDLAKVIAEPDDHRFPPPASERPLTLVE